MIRYIAFVACIFSSFLGNDQIAGLQSVGWLCPTQSVGYLKTFCIGSWSHSWIHTHMAHVHATKSDGTRWNQRTDTLIHSRRQAKLEPTTILPALGTSPWAYFEDLMLSSKPKLSYIIHNHQVSAITNHQMSPMITTLWFFNIAMENGQFIDDFPIKTTIYRGFFMAMLVITRG